LASERIPVSVSSFVFPDPEGLDASVFLFNQGADFAVRDRRIVRLGSFRNLYEDRGVGLHAAADERTRENISRFFTEKGWLGAESRPLSEGVSFESVSCDGLPIV